MLTRPAARRAAVLGKPVAHSLSPVLHRAGYAAAGLTDWRYDAIECGEDELAAFVAGLGPQWAGLSLTMPLKEVAPVVADEVTPVAAAAGAANTLVRTVNGSWLADNTDIAGMVAALRGAGVSTAGRVAILGAGGTARAALVAVGQLGAVEVTVHARRAEAVAALGSAATWKPWRDISGTTADLVISTVPKGVADDLAISWRPEMVLFDVLYDPWPTPLAAAARAAGCRVASGLDLLLAQALGQFELFTGVPAPAEAMRTALIKAAAHPHQIDHEVNSMTRRRTCR